MDQCQVVLFLIQKSKLCSLCFVSFYFYSAPTQFRSYDTKIGKMILAKLKLKATPDVKPHHLLELRDA
jgi:hypothetical protein